MKVVGYRGGESIEDCTNDMSTISYKGYCVIRGRCVLSFLVHLGRGEKHLQTICEVRDRKVVRRSFLTIMLIYMKIPSSFSSVPYTICFITQILE